ncbi:unnamed protein product [Lupinus luteus]|uniref:Kinetochore protein SPC25 n=1 Tax=Lupinus luteus TaxID=3873 RepID=A0AAV1XWM4_LUPLU
MESLTRICEREIPLQISKTDVSTASYLKSLELVWARAQETARFQVQLQEVKGILRNAEADLIKALALKTRKEAKRLALKDAIASPKGRIEHLKTSIQEQQAKNQHYATLLSQQSLVLNCEPSLGGTEELIHELNNTNGLFKFVRVMRRKFQEALAQGTTVEIFYSFR